MRRSKPGFRRTGAGRRAAAPRRQVPARSARRAPAQRIAIGDTGRSPLLHVPAENAAGSGTARASCSTAAAATGAAILAQSKLEATSERNGFLLAGARWRHRRGQGLCLEHPRRPHRHRQGARAGGRRRRRLPGQERSTGSRAKGCVDRRPRLCHRPVGRRADVVVARLRRRRSLRRDRAGRWACAPAIPRPPIPRFPDPATLPAVADRCRSSPLPAARTPPTRSRAVARPIGNIRCAPPRRAGPISTPAVARCADRTLESGDGARAMPIAVAAAEVIARITPERGMSGRRTMKRCGRSSPAAGDETSPRQRPRGGNALCHAIASPCQRDNDADESPADRRATSSSGPRPGKHQTGERGHVPCVVKAPDR